MESESTIKAQDKAVKLNSDIYLEDYELLNQVIAEKSLVSRKEGLHVIFNGYRGDSETVESEDCNCDFLIIEASIHYCGKNSVKPKKTTPQDCRVCLKAQKLAKRDEKRQEIIALGERMREDLTYRMEYAFFKRLGVPVDEVHNGVSILQLPLWERIHLANKFLDKQEAEIQELKKPIEEKLLELTNLKAEQASLETDNAYLRQQLDEVKRDSLVQENAWLRTELRDRNKEIETLKAESTATNALLKPNVLQEVKVK